MRSSSVLYWSSFSLYENCPQAFLWSKGWDGIDAGGGPGQPKPGLVRSSEHHAILGSAIQATLQDFYNNELWRDPTDLISHLHSLSEKHFSRLLQESYVDWRLAPSREDMLNTIHHGVSGFLQTFKHHKLLGPYARSEVDYTAYIDKDNPIGGRFDFVIQRDDTGLTILDGKNGREHFYKDADKPKLFVDPDQLIWYAMVTYLALGKIPDRLGFVYFRYPYGYAWEEEIKKAKHELYIATEKDKPYKQKVFDYYANREKANGIDWLEFDKSKIQRLADRAVVAKEGMRKHQFDARPSPSTCKFCEYETICPERQAQKQENREKRSGKKPLPVISITGGPVEFLLE